MTAPINETRKLFFLCMCVMCTLCVTFLYVTIFKTTVQYFSKEPSHVIVTIPPVINAQDVQVFQKIITNEEMEIFQILVKKFIDVVPKNVTYFLMYGSLLGAYRHHGVIPWDADVDLLIKASDKPFAHAVFTSLTSNSSSEFGFVQIEEYIWRFYHNRSVPAGPKLKWPYLDIFFYDENSTHIWNIETPWPKFVKTLIFPLRKIPFMRFMLPAPKETPLLLDEMYNLSICKWSFYRVIPRHPLRKSFKFKEVSCDLLMDKYPFVKRRDNGSGVIETLVLNGNPVPDHTPFFLEHSIIRSENKDL